MLSLFNFLFSFKRIYIIILTSTTMQIWACLSQSSATCHKDSASCFLGPNQSIASTLWCYSRAGSPWTQCGNLLSLCFFFFLISRGGCYMIYRKLLFQIGNILSFFYIKGFLLVITWCVKDKGTTHIWCLNSRPLFRNKKKKERFFWGVFYFFLWFLFYVEPHHACHVFSCSCCCHYCLFLSFLCFPL